jgi:hypothetical protein
MANLRVYKGRLSYEDKVAIHSALQQDILEERTYLYDGHFVKLFYRANREVEAAVKCCKCGIYFGASLHSKGSMG